jgi:hypothetical protein
MAVRAPKGAENVIFSLTIIVFKRDQTIAAITTTEAE